MIDCPVILPPGRARLATIPVATGSPIGPVTIGIVLVAFLAARLPGVVYATMIAGLRRTHSAARVGNRSYLPSSDRKLMLMLFPLRNPNRLDPGSIRHTDWPTPMRENLPQERKAEVCPPSAERGQRAATRSPRR